MSLNFTQLNDDLIVLTLGKDFSGSKSVVSCLSETHCSLVFDRRGKTRKKIKLSEQQAAKFCHFSAPTSLVRGPMQVEAKSIRQ